MGRKKKTLPYYEAKDLYITHGWSVEQIAKHYGITYATAKRELVRMGLYVTPETPNTTKQDCKKCIYRGCLHNSTDSVNTHLTCNYILITGHIRGCPIEHCTHFTEGKKIDTNALRRLKTKYREGRG